MKKKILKTYFILSILFLFIISSNTILGQSIDFFAPTSISIKTSAKDELDSVFAYHFNGLYSNSNELIKIKKIVDGETIYKDSYYCTNDQKHEVKNLFSKKCEICGSAIQFRPYIKYEFFNDAKNYRGQSFNQYSIKYSFIPEKEIFIAAIEETTEEGINGVYKKEISYISFSPFKGPIMMEVIEDNKKELIEFQNNSYTKTLKRLIDSLLIIKNNRTDSVLNLKSKKKEKLESIELIENDYNTTIKNVEEKLETEYLGKIGLYKLFNTKYSVRFLESIPGEVYKQKYNNNSLYGFSLNEGNYSFSLDGGNLRYNPNNINGLNNNVITRKSYSPKPSNYPLVYNYIYNYNDKSNDYLLGLAYENKTSKYIKRYKTSNGGFVEISDEDPEISRNLRSSALGPVAEAFFVDVSYYKLFILSKFGHPVFLVPGGFYKNIKSIGNNEFEATNVQSGQNIKLVLSNNAKSIYDIMK